MCIFRVCARGLFWSSTHANHHHFLSRNLQTSGGEIRKRPRACDSCRQLKVACKLDEGQPCKRCKKANRTCIITPPARTRKRKGPDSNRISELERKVEQLTAQLASNVHATAYSDGYAASVVHGGPPYEASPPQPQYQPDQRLLGGPIEQNRRRESYPPPQYQSPDMSPHKRQRISGADYGMDRQGSIGKEVCFAFFPFSLLICYLRSVQVLWSLLRT